MDKCKKNLIELTNEVAVFLGRLDGLMKLPSTNVRGAMVANLCNHLEFVNDSAMHFTLDYGWNKINNIKRNSYGSIGNETAKKTVKIRPDKTT